MAVILLVDDDPVKRELMVAILEHLGHTFLEASDGERALAVAHAAHPHLIICDMLMPHMNGYEFVRRLREMPDLAQTKVIFYTALYPYDKLLLLAQSCGVEYVISYPMDPKMVIAITHAALGGLKGPISSESMSLVGQLQEIVDELEQYETKVTQS